MTDWLRLWHDMPTDPKWRVIARKSGQPLPCVIALYTLMLTTASAADDRGSIASLTDEDAAAALDMDEEDVAAIKAAMTGRVLDGDRLTGWERRQPKRERENDDSSQRVKKHREAKANAVTEDVTPRNAMQRQETPREEKSREDIPLSNDNGATPDKIFWDRAKPYIGGRNPGGVIGKWCRDYGRDQTKRAITEAQAANAVEPIPYVERVLRKTKVSESVPVC
jgi:hypothetical protein